MIAVAEEGTPLHTADFAAAAVGERATRAIRDGAVLLAQLAAAMGTDGELRESVIGGHQKPKEIRRILHAD